MTEITRKTRKERKLDKLLEKEKKYTGWKKYLHYLFVTFKTLFKFGVIIFFMGALAGGLYITKVLKETPVITEDTLKTATAGTTNMFASDGTTIIYSDTNNIRDYITKDKIPKLYSNLLLSTEDKDYYKESGYSLKGTLNGVKGVLTSSSDTRGGSTIEQQLIKNLVFSTSAKDRTINRKIKELWLSLQMDKNFSKEQILEWYINLIYLGENSYGANTIAITYYNQPLESLNDRSPETISKLAIIAGLGQSPSAYNLYTNPEGVKERRNIILKTAYKNNVITKKEYNEALNVDVTTGLQERYWRNSTSLAQTTEHSAYITSALQQIKDLGYDLEKTHLQIYTGLDLQTDSDVKSIVDNFYGYQSDTMQAATTIIDPTTGLVKAQYGGRNTTALGYNRATQNSRSSGSSTKPFISYGPAIENFGYSSGSTLDSSNYLYPGTNVVAYNYGGYTYGYVPMWRALKLSLNTPAIRLLDNVLGSQKSKNFLSKLNLDVKDTYGGADALGINISTQQLAASFATLSNFGTYKTPQYITKIKFTDGSEKEIKFPEIQAMKESTAYILLKMLEQVPTADGTANKAILPYSGHAVKTGTVGYDESYGFADETASDIWIGGTTKSASIAVWMGYDEPYVAGNQIYKAYYSNQQLLYTQLMEYMSNGKDTSDWSQPNTVSGSSISNYTPTDTKTNTTSSYLNITTPNVKELPNTLSKYTKKSSIKDEGYDTYKMPSDYDSILNWKSNIDDNLYAYFNTYSNAKNAILNTQSVYSSE